MTKEAVNEFKKKLSGSNELAGKVADIRKTAVHALVKLASDKGLIVDADDADELLVILQAAGDELSLDAMENIAGGGDTSSGGGGFGGGGGGVGGGGVGGTTP